MRTATAFSLRGRARVGVRGAPRGARVPLKSLGSGDSGDRSLLLVSDLDGTMVGDNRLTEDFTEYWKGRGRGSSRLVYSTGRTLSQYEELKEEKGEVLSEPFMLICAVGTRVYEKRDGAAWIENEKWRDQLNERWCEDSVLSAAKEAIAEFGQDNAHLRPHHEMNSHKITLGMRSSLVGEAKVFLEDYLTAAGVSPKLVSSGSGEWRYLDILPTKAGKLESLEFVRTELGFGPEQTCACGDSGNDVAMLEGRNLGIIVGNAQSDLFEWWSANETEAKGRVYLSSRPMAAGILDGLDHFGLL